MLKRWVKVAAAKTSGHIIGRWFVKASDVRVTVLCYHSIHPTKEFATVTPVAFEEHLNWLRANTTIVSFDRAFEVLANESARGPHVVITFDDGYADNYEFAMPLLLKYKVPATFFVTTGLVARDRYAVERCEMLRKAPFNDIRPMDWLQLREMSELGMAIAAHTDTHPNLALMPRRAAVRELTISRERLEQELGSAVLSMAYPFGKPGCHFTEETMSAAEEAGYQRAAAVIYRSIRTTDSPFAIPRFTIARDSVETLREKVLGWWDILGSWQERRPLWAARFTSPEDFSLR